MAWYVGRQILHRRRLRRIPTEPGHRARATTSSTPGSDRAGRDLSRGSHRCGCSTISCRARGSLAKVRRGFIEEAKRLALEVRAELGLDGIEPLDPRKLANVYGIPIYPLDELAAYNCP